MEGEFALYDSDDREQAEHLFLEAEKNLRRTQQAPRSLCFRALVHVIEDKLESHPSL